MAYTLVVIDMQRCFEAAEWAERGVLKAINAAKRLSNPILVVRYYCYNNVLPSVKQAVSDYELGFNVVKKHDDGSKEIARVVKSKRLPLPLRICGVNTNACVKRTIYGLTQRQWGGSAFIEPHQIRLVVSACESDACHRDGIEALKYHGVQLRLR